MDNVGPGIRNRVFGLGVVLVDEDCEVNLFCWICGEVGFIFGIDCCS